MVTPRGMMLSPFPVTGSCRPDACFRFRFLLAWRYANERHRLSPPGISRSLRFRHSAFHSTLAGATPTVIGGIGVTDPCLSLFCPLAGFCDHRYLSLTTPRVIPCSSFPGLSNGSGFCRELLFAFVDYPTGCAVSCHSYLRLALRVPFFGFKTRFVLGLNLLLPSTIPPNLAVPVSRILPFVVIN